MLISDGNELIAGIHLAQLCNADWIVNAGVAHETLSSELRKLGERFLKDLYSFHFAVSESVNNLEITGCLTGTSQEIARIREQVKTNKASADEIKRLLASQNGISANTDAIVALERG